jgi:hypothetical protein
MPARSTGEIQGITGKEVRRVADKKDCGCGCVPPGKTSKPIPKTENPKTEKAKAPKEQKK